RVPDGDGARLPGQVRRVGKHVADEAEEARVLSEAPLALFIAVTEVLLDDRRVLVARRVRNIVQLKKCHRAMAEIGERRAQSLGGGALDGIAPASATRSDAREIDGTVADVVVRVPGEVLGGE